MKHKGILPLPVFSKGRGEKKRELMVSLNNLFPSHDRGVGKLALYAEGSGGKSSTTATLGATTTAFTTTGEVASSGTYTTGGGSLTRVDPSLPGS